MHRDLGAVAGLRSKTMNQLAVGLYGRRQTTQARIDSLLKNRSIIYKR
jgi:hypothetical protein